MHWARRAAAGFTRGTPWEPLQPDSFTANVEAQDADTGSLLNHYRRLIHLRTANPALGSGELVPLAASSEAVAAYLRREEAEGRAVLVIANLGSATLSRVTLSSEERVLPAGRYTARSLIGGLSVRPLVVGADGKVRAYVPVGSLRPFESLVIQLSGAGR
jgi:alpha-amylase